MQKTIEAIYEDGVLKPTKKITLPEHSRLKLIVIRGKKSSKTLAKKQSEALLSIAGIGESGLSGVSEHPEKYLR
ncbi:MAG: antitoxin family protein [Nitrospirae bacterium]|nr:antitoxin family protein [Nitrospirota bacterium]